MAKKTQHERAMDEFRKNHKDGTAERSKKRKAKLEKGYPLSDGRVVEDIDDLDDEPVEGDVKLGPKSGKIKRELSPEEKKKQDAEVEKALKEHERRELTKKQLSQT